MKKIGMKLTGFLTAVMLVATLLPYEAIGNIASAANGTGSSDSRIADISTMDSWQEYFGTDENFSTRHSGRVWTDKSVHKDASAFQYASELASGSEKIEINEDDENNFLVSLSAMSASKAVKGEANKPTNTMLILDLSSSMYRSSNGQLVTTTVQKMLTSVNTTMTTLQAMNSNNKVGVVIYYGGPTRIQATKDSHKVLLPLGRYRQTNNVFLEVTKNGSQLKGVKVNSNVKTEAGTSVSASHDVTEIAGTYTQQGILAAMQELKNAEPTVPEDADYQAGQSITPIMVLMSDGEPTAATYEYTRLDTDADMGNNTVALRDAEETDFVTQLSAAYARKIVDDHYAAEDPLFYTLSLNNPGYDVSWDVMDPVNTRNSSTFTPSAEIDGYWDTLLNNGSVGITIMKQESVSGGVDQEMNYTVSKTLIEGKAFPSSKAQKGYVDKTFEAENADDLADAFEEILGDINIQTHYHPTFVEDDENLDGYISFVDKIGKYMSVTDVKGIILGEQWYSGKELSKNFVPGGGNLGTYDDPTSLGNELVRAVQLRFGIADAATARTLIGNAYNAGQLSYNTTTGEYSNYVGWYADETGKYVDFWDGKDSGQAKEGAVYAIKSYGYLGEVDEAHGIKDSDMMYTTIQVRTEIATGEETVTFAVPAALIPLVEYDVELDEEGKLDSLTKGGADKPIRLVYEVALDDEVNEKTIYDPKVVDSEYVSGNTKDGKVSFYTNQYQADKTAGYGKVNTYSYFRPAHENENYYYQNNETIYRDKDGSVYRGETKPADNGTYYRAIKTYKKDGSAVSSETIYRQLSSAALETALASETNPDENTTWYIPKGNVHVNMDGYTRAKPAGAESVANPTETLDNSNLPFVDVYNHNVSESGHRFVIGDTLGNNGKVSIEPLAGLKLSKSARGEDGGNITDNDTGFTFTIEADLQIADSVKGKNFGGILVKSNGDESAETVSFDDDAKAEVILKSGESLYITGIPEGEYTISEAETEDYVLEKIKVNDDEQSGKEAVAEVANEALADVEFINRVRGTGDITIAKVVSHELGTSYQIPANVDNFYINIELSGIAIKEGDTFEIKRSSGSSEDEKETVTVKDGEIGFYIRTDEQVEVLGLPEGTKAKISERSVSLGFSASYVVNGQSSAENEPIVEIVKEPYIDLVAITNTYKPRSASVNINLSGTKVLIDANGNEIESWGDKSFDFIIQKYVYVEPTDGQQGGWQWVNTEEVDTVTAPGNGNIDFSETGRELSFDKVGTYAYQVIEKNHGMTIDGVTYDSTMHTFNVIVTDKNMDGQLEAKVESSHMEGEHGDGGFVFDEKSGTWVNNHIDFTNVYNNGKTRQTVMIEKLLENPSASEAVSLEGYQFELYECGEDYEPITIRDTSIKTDAAGETYISWEYNYEDIKQALQNGPVTYRYMLKEKPSGIAGMTNSTAKYYFDVTVSAVGGADSGKITSAVNTAPNLPQGKTNSSWGTFIGAGSTDENPITYPLAAFTNTYEPTEAEVELDVSKTIEGRALTDGEFGFTMKPITEGAPLPDTTKKEGKDGPIAVVYNSSDGEGGFGKIDFGKIIFSKVGVYEYEIYENPARENSGVTIDTNKYRVLITVSDEKGADGKFTGKLTASVNVLNTSEDSITFKNTYEAEPAEVVIVGSKKLTGQNLTSSRFRFTLTETNEEGEPKAGGKTLTATNEENGNFAFPAIKLGKPGTYYYKVAEEIPKETHGVIYDRTVYKVTVTVAEDIENGKYLGRLKATLDIDRVDENGEIRPAENNKIAFVNKYVPATVAFSAPGFKTLEGKALEDKQFEFALYPADENWQKTGEALKTVKNNANGTFEFGEILYEYEVDEDDDSGENEADRNTDSGENEADRNTEEPYEKAYYYVIEEINSGKTIDGITYDSKSIGVKITVKDNGRGSLTTDALYYDLTKQTDDSGDEVIESEQAAGMRFDNKYEVSGETELIIEGSKILEGRDLKDGEFGFELLDSEGKVIQTAQNDKDGRFKFSLKYTDEEIGNIYEYTIREKSGSEEGVKYDSKEYRLSVEIKDDGKGKVAAELTVKRGLFDQDEISFTNKYTQPGSVKTGDSADILLFAMFAVISLMGAAYLLTRRKTEREQ